MSNEQEKINRELRKYPWTHKTFFNRPHWTRRRFFEVLGAGVTGSYLAHRNLLAADTSGAGVTKGTAQNVIFILLAGAPSHTDTFDLKMVNGITPTSFAPDTINGAQWPVGLLPKLADQFSHSTFTIVRSMRAWALVHSLA